MELQRKEDVVDRPVENGNGEAVLRHVLMRRFVAEGNVVGEIELPDEIAVAVRIETSAILHMHHKSSCLGRDLDFKLQSVVSRGIIIQRLVDGPESVVHAEIPPGVRGESLADSPFRRR